MNQRPRSPACSPGEEQLIAPTGRHHPSRSGDPAVKRLAAGTPRRLRNALRHDPDDRWAAAFGRIAGYSFAVALVTGILLLPYFHASMAPVVYRGSYAKLDGLPVSRAFASVLAVSFDIRGGLLVRQVHHWSADIFVAAAVDEFARYLVGEDPGPIEHHWQRLHRRTGRGRASPGHPRTKPV